MTESFNFNAIGYIRNGFKEKFTVPRQAGLVRSMESAIELLPAYANPDAFRALQQFSHIWVVFVFDQSLGKDWRPTVRPPRLGGNTRVGVFASRSPYRPNPIGLSAVELVEVSTAGGEVSLKIRGADLVDGTPVLDIKPYVPYADSIAASSGYAPTPATEKKIEFTGPALTQVREAEQRLGQPVKKIIEEILVLDPRPAYRDDRQQVDENNLYGVRLFDFDMKFRVQGEVIEVVAIDVKATGPSGD